MIACLKCVNCTSKSKEITQLLFDNFRMLQEIQFWLMEMFDNRSSPHKYGVEEICNVFTCLWRIEQLFAQNVIIQCMWSRKKV